MFFHISQQPQENYPCHWQLGSFAVSTDEGWKQLAIGPVQILYKGYADAGPLESLLGQVMFQSTPQLTGNFCALVVVNDTLAIQSDRYRGFPIYINDTGINNLVATDRTAWTDSLITMHADLSVTENKFDVIGNIDTGHSTVNDIDSLLSKKIQQYAQQATEPIRVFLSGGVDTLLVYSYLRRYQIPHQLVWAEHCEHDAFWLANHADICKNWGYQQIHHWQESCVLASGAPGDEFMLRSPVTANQYLMHHGSSILQLLTEYPDCLHREYFKLQKHVKVFSDQMCNYRSAATDQDFNWSVCNTVVNDWQHWHIGNTLTWTPLRDLELFKLCLRLPPELAKGQIMNSTVSRVLIEQNVPGLTSVLSDQKNTGNVMRNLQQLLS
jgi:hypothetical protein